MKFNHFYDAIIIGGGLVGATAAIALKKQGKHIALLELNPPEYNDTKLLNGWDARVYAVSPTNRQFLQSLEAWPDESRIQAVTRMDVSGDNSGRIEFNCADIHAERLTSIIENRWLLSALWQQITALNIPVLNKPAAAVTTKVNEACLKLADGTDLKAKLIIGADGADSWLRHQAGIHVTTTTYNHHGVVANFNTELDHRNTAYQWFGQGEVLAYLPLPGNRISIVWSIAEPQKLTSLSPEEFAAAVARKGRNTLGKLSLLSNTFAFKLLLRCPASTVAQRILLMGDAAHTIHPLAGQGVNLGFGDAIEFTRLAKQAEDIGAHQLLKQYAQNRFEPVHSMQLGCDSLFKLFAARTPGLPTLRNTGLNLINRSIWLKKRLIRHAIGI